MEKEQKIILDKIDELLCLRESRKNSLRDLNRLILQGFDKAKCLPTRWYVTNPQKSVIDYLENKYGKKLTRYDNLPIGYGELHDCFAFVPHDVDYSWEITQDEFDYIMSII